MPHLPNDKIWREKLACSYFFAVPALAYGVLTARLPAIKALVGANDGQMGGLLLALGAATLCGLVTSGFFIEKTGAKNMAGVSALFLCAAITLAGLSLNFWQLAICCAIAGLGVGFCDVAMNALGILVEQRHNILCMAFLHAISSLGGVAGSLSGSLFAALQLSPFLNLLLVLGAYLLLWPVAFRNIENFPAGGQAPSSLRNFFRAIPCLVLICGVMSLFCHIAEGSAAEWGSLLLHTVKGASQQQAALVFAVFTATMVGGRLITDRLRIRISDFAITFAGSAAGALGMAIVLISPWPSLCLAGYALMGFGLAPITPILFSRAGAAPGVTAAQASSVVSVFSYAGLLFFPPFLGMLAQYSGLTTALWLIVGCCLIIAACSLALHGKRS